MQRLLEVWKQHLPRTPSGGAPDHGSPWHLPPLGHRSSSTAGARPMLGPSRLNVPWTRAPEAK